MIRTTFFGHVRPRNTCKVCGEKITPMNASFRQGLRGRQYHHDYCVKLWQRYYREWRNGGCYGVSADEYIRNAITTHHTLDEIRNTITHQPNNLQMQVNDGRGQIDPRYVDNEELIRFCLDIASKAYPITEETSPRTSGIIFVDDEQGVIEWIGKTANPSEWIENYKLRKAGKMCRFRFSDVIENQLRQVWGELVAHFKPYKMIQDPVRHIREGHFW